MELTGGDHNNDSEYGDPRTRVIIVISDVSRHRSRMISLAIREKKCATST
jgi:hypothetical protein